MSLLFLNFPIPYSQFSVINHTQFPFLFYPHWPFVFPSLTIYTYTFACNPSSFLPARPPLPVTTRPVFPRLPSS